jgi:hypothetical protein
VSLVVPKKTKAVNINITFIQEGVVHESIHICVSAAPKVMLPAIPALCVVAIEMAAIYI